MSPRIKEFVNDAQGKVKIALALAIIIKTPPGKTAKAYARELQEEILKQWHNNVEDTFENKTIYRLLAERMHRNHQERDVASELSSLIPSSDGSPQSTSSFQDTDSGFCSWEMNNGKDSELSCLSADNEKPLGVSEDVRETLCANLGFIRGVVHLQALIAESADEVVGRKFVSVLSEINRSTSASKSRKGRPTNCSNGKKNLTVASSVIQYTLQASNAEAIVEKSLKEIQRHISGIALQSTQLPRIIADWEGSLLQHSVAVLRRLSEEKNSQKAVIKSTRGLATVFITDMINNDVLEMNTKMENQTTILLQLCGNTVICSEVLQVLTEKINLLSSMTVARAHHHSKSLMTPPDQAIYFENYYYIFNLTEKLLTRYFFLQQNFKSSYENLPKISKEESEVSELWREAWQKNDRSKVLLNMSSHQFCDNSELYKSWLTILENAAKVCSFDYPLVTIYANHCGKIIASYQRKCTKNTPNHQVIVSSGL